MEDRKMNAKEILEETVGILGNVKVPIAMNDIGVILYGCMKNIAIAISMMNNEQEAKSCEDQVEKQD